MTLDQQPLASFSLTHVHYNPDDPFSYGSAWLALVPQALCVIYVTLIWASREVEIMLMFVGQIGCEALSFALKRLIREERPQYMQGKGYGMPSSHAQFVAYFACYVTLFLLLRHKPNFSITPQAVTFIQRVALSFLACVGASVVAVSRIYLNYHTKKQVLAGVLAGVIFTIIWFSFISYLRASGCIEWGLNLYLARLFRLRDLVISEDLTEAGWQRWEAQRKLKRRENGGVAHKSD